MRIYKKLIKNELNEIRTNSIPFQLINYSVLKISTI